MIFRNYHENNLVLLLIIVHPVHQKTLLSNIPGSIKIKFFWEFIQKKYNFKNKYLYLLFILSFFTKVIQRKYWFSSLLLTSSIKENWKEGYPDSLAPSYSPWLTCRSGSCPRCCCCSVSSFCSPFSSVSSSPRLFFSFAPCWPEIKHRFYFHLETNSEL